MARRNFEKARANTETAQKALSDTRILAPLTGIIAKKMADRFQNVQAKQQILAIHDNSSLEMAVEIPEQDFMHVNTGISLDELTRQLKPEILISSLPDRQFPATLKEAATIADPRDRDRRVKTV